MKLFNQRNKILSGLLVLSVVNLSVFQNCSKPNFSIQESSQVLGESCVDNTDVSLQPKLKWDWHQKLDKSNKNNLPEYKQVMATPVAADLNNDGQTEVVFISFFSGKYKYILKDPGVLRIINGDTGETIKSFGGPDESLSPVAAATPLLIDLNGDKKLEIIFVSSANNKEIVALNFDGSLRWTYSAGRENADFTGLSATDINADGQSDILINGAVITENANAEPVELFSFNSSSNRQFTFSLDPNKPKELQIISTHGVYDSQGKTLFLLSVQASIISAADVDLNSPGVEIIASGGNNIHIMSGLNGKVLKSININTAGYAVGGGITSIGNFDDNAETLEIALATDRALLVFSSDLTLIASSPTQDKSSQATSIVSFDRNGDGKPEILYGDEEYLRIYEIENGELKVLNKIVNPSGTLNEYPIFADLNNNGSAELLVVSNNYAVAGLYKDAGEELDSEIAKNITGVRAFESAGQQGWMHTRKIHNQFYYNPMFVSDSGLAMPFTLFDSFLAKTFLRNAPLNGFEKVCTPITGTVKEVK